MQGVEGRQGEPCLGMREEGQGRSSVLHRWHLPCMFVYRSLSSCLDSRLVLSESPS